MIRLALIIFISIGIASFSLPAQSQQKRICAAQQHGHLLDFWLGRWRVVDPMTFAEFGENRIVKTLSGCAVEEYWSGADGVEGRSFFYLNTPAGVWEQVWITDDPRQLGGLKLKTQQANYTGDGFQFQGILKGTGNRQILDRTTVYPVGEGRVRQLIEQSVDGGLNWRTTFDAIYIPIGK